jgi:Holliday junction resolvase
MNKRAKGMRAERKAAKLLMDMGYQVVRPNFNRFGYTDFFNLWDIIAVKEDSALFIQVKTNATNASPSRLKKHREFKCPPCIVKQCWLLVPRKPLKIIDL